MKKVTEYWHEIWQRERAVLGAAGAAWSKLKRAGGVNSCGKEHSNYQALQESSVDSDVPVYISHQPCSFQYVAMPDSPIAALGVLPMFYTAIKYDITILAHRWPAKA